MATGRYNRLALDENDLKQAGKDVDTGKSPVFTLASAYTLNVAHIVDDEVASISDWVSVRVQISSQCNKGGDRYLDRTQNSLNQALTQSQWDNGTGQHASFAFTSDDMNLALSACDNGPLYFVVTATRTDGEIIPLGTGTINVDRAYQVGTNLVLAPAGSNYPQLAFTTSYTVGPQFAFTIIPNAMPNSFQIALTIPPNNSAYWDFSTPNVLFSDTRITFDQVFRII